MVFPLWLVSACNWIQGIDYFHAWLNWKIAFLMKQICLGRNISDLLQFISLQKWKSIAKKLALTSNNSFGVNVIWAIWLGPGNGMSNTSLQRKWNVHSIGAYPSKTYYAKYRYKRFIKSPLMKKNLKSRFSVLRQMFVSKTLVSFFI